MTDSRLQELKRAWEASGSVDDEAAYLRERVRVGDLTQERLELAAYWGQVAARMVTGEGVHEHEVAVEDALKRPKAAYAPLLAALANRLLPQYERRFGEDARLRVAVNAALAWCRCPCSQHEKAVVSASRQPAPTTEADRARLVVSTACLAAGLPDQVEDPFDDYPASSAAQFVFQTLRGDDTWEVPPLGSVIADWTSGPL